jgi:hypothetical protein
VEETEESKEAEDSSSAKSETVLAEEMIPETRAEKVYEIAE